HGAGVAGRDKARRRFATSYPVVLLHAYRESTQHADDPGDGQKLQTESRAGSGLGLVRLPGRFRFARRGLDSNLGLGGRFGWRGGRLGWRRRASVSCRGPVGGGRWRFVPRRLEERREALVVGPEVGSALRTPRRRALAGLNDDQRVAVLAGEVHGSGRTEM